MLSWWLPGMELISCRIPRPCRTKSGKMKSPTSKDVSRTISRTNGLERSRRGRTVGKLPND